jgi:YD repeat-containing protein
LTSLQSPTDGTTTYTYDGAGGRGTKDAARLTQLGLLSTKTKGNGDYELYAYDTADQLTSIGYWWYDGTEQNALVYGYDPAGNVKTVNQGYYATTYGYDGADQLTSETSTGSYPPPTVGYTYDSNGNRKTQTQNGQPRNGHRTARGCLETMKAISG